MKRFMIVDTSSVVRKIAKRILMEEGAVVYEAEAGDHMLEMCSYEMPDCIIMTASLPDMEPQDAVAALRNLPDGRKPKIILLTIELNVGRIMKVKRAGADGYMMKPFTRQILFDAIRQVSPQEQGAPDKQAVHTAA
ncbi:MAG: response regulator [Rhizobiaceae bacterium]|jgi:two-component system chemotaxis response regulator CheY|nr:response regulator [Rhizobiaceae bacterium]